MPCSSFPSVGIKWEGKSGYNVPATHSWADASLVPDFIWWVWECTWRSYWRRPISNDDLYSACAWESHDRKVISRLSSISTEVNRSPPMLRYLIPDCTADKFWHFSSISETHNTHHSLMKGLLGYSLSFGIHQLCCSILRKQFSSWLVAVWGKKCIFQLIGVPGSAF